MRRRRPGRRSLDHPQAARYTRKPTGATQNITEVKTAELAAQAAAAAAAIRAEPYTVDFESQAERAQVELGLAAPSTLQQLEKAALTAEKKALVVRLGGEGGQ